MHNRDAPQDGPIGTPISALEEELDGVNESAENMPRRVIRVSVAGIMQDLKEPV